MRFDTLNNSARRLLIPILLMGVVCGAGCRRISKQSDSPTPLPDAWQPGTEAPAYPELAPPPTSNPSDLQPIPPLPSAAALFRPYDANEEFGGFTVAGGTQLTAGSEPAVESPFVETLDLPPLPDLATTAPELADADLHTEAAVPVAVTLRNEKSVPVDLDSLQFVIDLTDDGWQAAPPQISLPSNEQDGAGSMRSASDNLPQVAAAPQTVEAQRPPLLEWPQSGLPHGMIITPGPTTEKWSPRRVATDIPGSRSLPPQRLVHENLDWELRRME